MNTQLSIRYITGRGGSGTGGLSAFLRELSDDFDVLPIDPEFLLQDLEHQIDAVKFVQLDGGNIIANSYGAYLLLQTFVDQPPLKIRVLLLSQFWGGRLVKKECFSVAHLGRRPWPSPKSSVPQYLKIVTGKRTKFVI